MQDDTDCCYICYGCREKLDRHEIFGGANRSKSKRLGLWVTLCHSEHHIFGPGAVHQCREVDLALKRMAQQEAMIRYGWTREDFIREFGRNYLDTE